MKRLAQVGLLLGLAFLIISLMGCRAEVNNREE